ncbi:hypothetical protein ACIOWI_34495 [Streptomyces sp. NPDC087659]|uniref:hypothetical protein n=1 Tax=Streptomyces sp. NPDC087659 TaxID=3365801 RepID=UPI00382594FD
MNRTARHHIRAALIATAVCTGLTLAACTSSKPMASEASPTSSPDRPSVPADPTETAKQEAIAAYQNYWQEMEKLYADRSGKAADLKKFAASAALKNAESDAKSIHARNFIHLGGVTVNDSTVTKVEAAGKVPHAVLTSCLDISRWQVVDATTKKPATLPSNRLTRFVITSTVERWPQGWRVIRDDPQGKRC